MGKVKDYLYTNTPREVIADSQDMQNCEFDNDPEYVEWSNSIDEQFKKEFGDNAKQSVEKPPF